MTDRGIGEEAAQQFRLGHDPETSRLLIPYLTPAGPWTVKLRCIEDHDCKTVGHKTKYIYEQGAEPHLFNASVLLEASQVVVVEGELDAITISQLGVPAVAYPGASNWLKHFRWCFDSADEVVVVADGDEPGVKAAGSVADSLRSVIQGDVRTVVMPDGHDANSFINQFGDVEFLAEIGWI